ncbi:hypothetical protein WAI453_001885 [Rhynchosporium graminicola]
MLQAWWKAIPSMRRTPAPQHTGYRGTPRLLDFSAFSAQSTLPVYRTEFFSTIRRWYTAAVQHRLENLVSS